MNDSLTPPLSPRLDDPVGIKHQLFPPKLNLNLPLFDCRQSIEGYLSSCHLEKVLEKCQIFPEKFKHFLLFGKLYHPVQCFLVPDQAKHIFSLVRKNVSILRKAAVASNKNQAENLQYSHIRREVSNFGNYAVAFLLDLYVRQFECEKVLPSSFLSGTLLNLLKELKILLLSIGRLSDVPSAVYRTAVNKVEGSNVCHLYYHTCLDLWWISLEIFHIVQIICDARSINIHFVLVTDNLFQGAESIISQASSLVLWDLVCLSLNCYKPNTLQDSSSPFLCDCLKEFWILMITLVNYRRDQFNERSFWSMLHLVNQHLVKSSEEAVTSPVLVESFHLQTTSSLVRFSPEFCLWLIGHVAGLFKYDLMGKYVASKVPESYPLLVKHIIEQKLPTDMLKKNEKVLRSLLSQLLPLVKLWEQWADVLFLLTDFYIKRFDDSFDIPSIEIQGMSYLCKDSKSWLAKIENIVQCESVSRQCSYEIYLHILSYQMQQHEVWGNLWRQLKGRIYCKLSPKRLKDLTEVGLQNCLTLLLIIAHGANLDEVALKVCEFAKLLQTSGASFKKQVVALKAIFSIILSAKMTGETLSKIVSVVSEMFDKACSEYSSLSQNTMQKNNIMNYLLAYVDNVQIVFESASNITLNECGLISKGFLILLQNCGTELGYLLETVLIILSRFLSLSVNNEDESLQRCNEESLLKQLLGNIYPFIEHHSCTNTPPTQLADIAVLFTFLVSKFRNSTQVSLSHSDLFRHFGHNEQVNVKIASRYLTGIVKDDYLLDEIKNTIPDLPTLMLQSWLRCCLLEMPPSNNVNELSKTVLMQTEVQRSFPELRYLTFGVGQHDSLCITFFQLLGQSCDKCHTLHDRNRMKEQAQVYFKSLSSVISSVFRHDPIQGRISLVYKLSSHLVLHCAPLLYLKYKSDTILPDLIDLLLFPHLVFPKDKFLPATLASHIKSHLPYFIQGLAKLDIKHDAYVSRKLKDIVIHYLSNLPVGPSNPIVLACIDAATQKNTDLNFFSLMVEIIKDDFILVPSSRSIYGYQFCLEIMKRVPTLAKKRVCDTLLMHLVFLLLKFEASMAHTNKELIHALFSFLKRDAAGSYRKEIILSICQSLVKEKLAWSQFKVFRALEYIVEHFPSIIVDFIPILCQHIEYLESQRGTGVDENLRKELRNIVDKVQKGNSS